MQIVLTGGTGLMGRVLALSAGRVIARLELADEHLDALDPFAGSNRPDRFSLAARRCLRSL